MPTTTTKSPYNVDGTMADPMQEMNNAWPSGGSGTAVNPQATHALRRAGVTAELLASLLRLLEFVAGGCGG